MWNWSFESSRVPRVIDENVATLSIYVENFHARCTKRFGVLIWVSHVYLWILKFLKTSRSTNETLLSCFSHTRTTNWSTLFSITLSSPLVSLNKHTINIEYIKKLKTYFHGQKDNVEIIEHLKMNFQVVILCGCRWSKESEAKKLATHRHNETRRKQETRGKRGREKTKGRIVDGNAETSDKGWKRVRRGREHELILGI